MNTAKLYEVYANDLVKRFLAKGGEVTKGKYHAPRKGEQPWGNIRADIAYRGRQANNLKAAR